MKRAFLAGLLLLVVAALGDSQNFISGPATVNPGNAANTTPWLTNPWGMADSIAGGGNVAAPAAAATIATITPGVAGSYLVHVTVGVSGTAAAGDFANMNLNKNAALISLLANPMGLATTQSPTTRLGPYRVTVTAATDTINVTAIAAASAGTQYAASIIATRVN